MFKVSNGYLYILKALLSPAESVASYMVISLDEKKTFDLVEREISAISN